MYTKLFSDLGPIKISNKLINKANQCSEKDCLLKIYYSYSNIKLFNNNHDGLRILFDKNNYVTYNNSVYKLEYVMFSKNQNHYINDESLGDNGIEMFIVHSNFTDKNKKLIISVIVEKGIESYTENPFFKKFHNKFHNIVYPDINEKLLLFTYKEKMTLFNALPYNKDFYEYGYNKEKNIINIVFKNTIKINEDVFNDIKHKCKIQPKSTIDNISDLIINKSENSVNNRYEHAAVITGDELRDTCVSIYKEKTNEFNFKGFKYISYLKYILLFNLFFISLLLVLDMIGILPKLLLIFNNKYTHILSCTITNLSYIKKIPIIFYLLLGIPLLIGLIYLIIKYVKPFKIVKNVEYDENGNEIDLNLEVDNKLDDLDKDMTEEEEEELDNVVTDYTNSYF